MNAALEFMTARPVKLGAQCVFYKETIISTIVVPTLWLLLCAAVLSSHAYDCTEFPCRSKHYVYPVPPYSLPAPDSLAACCLPVLYLFAASGAVHISETPITYVPLCIWVSCRHQRETLCSVVPCRQSLWVASTVLLLFLCPLLTSSAIATLMLQGVYTGGDYYQDNQYVPLRAQIRWPEIVCYAGTSTSGTCSTWVGEDTRLSNHSLCCVLVLRSLQCLCSLEEAIIMWRQLR